MGDVDHVPQNQVQVVRKWTLNGRVPPSAGGWSCPRLFILVLDLGDPNADDTSFPLGLPNDSLDLNRPDLSHPGQKCPLIGEGDEVLIEEYTVAALPSLLLEGQGDQVPEAALRQRVLVGEQPVIRVEADIRAGFHGFGQEKGTELPGQSRGDGFIEEEPDMAASAGTGPLEHGWKRMAPAGCEEGLGIRFPVFLVEVCGKEETPFIEKHRVESHDERPPGIVLAGQMPPDDFVRQGTKAPVRALGTLDRFLVAEVYDPLVGAGGGIPGVPGLAADEPPGIDIVPATEEGPEKGHLRLGRRMLGDRAREQQGGAGGGSGTSDHGMASAEPGPGRGCQPRMLPKQPSKNSLSQALNELHELIGIGFGGATRTIILQGVPFQAAGIQV